MLDEDFDESSQVTGCNHHNQPTGLHNAGSVVTTALKSEIPYHQQASVVSVYVPGGSWGLISIDVLTVLVTRLPTKRRLG